MYNLPVIASKIPSSKLTPVITSSSDPWQFCHTKVLIMELRSDPITQSSDLHPEMGGMDLRMVKDIWRKLAESKARLHHESWKSKKQ